MEAVIAVFALLFVLFVVLGVYATVKVVGAAKRGVDRGHHPGPPHGRGPHPAGQVLRPARRRPGELAQLRLKLRTSMRATQDALHAAVAEDESLKESLGLFQRLSAHGHELDAELQAPGVRAGPRHARPSGCPDCASAPSASRTSADSLRWAARDRARRFADDDLDTLSAQIDVEAGRPAALDDAGGRSPPRSRGPRPPPPMPNRRRADLAGNPAAEPGRRAGTARHHPARPRPTYPWQKKPRPESTT